MITELDSVLNDVDSAFDAQCTCGMTMRQHIENGQCEVDCVTSMFAVLIDLAALVGIEKKTEITSSKSHKK
jgi:hypothetical protein